MKNLDKNFIKELKYAILESRYRAARAVNKELISLYFNIGEKINFNTRKSAWGSKVLGEISTSLQNELPGLKGFSAGNLKKMKVFAEFWTIENSIRSTVSNELENVENSIRSTLSNELQITNNEGVDEKSSTFLKSFFSVSFSHHYLITSKSKTIEEAKFYIYKIASEFWSYRTLQHHLKSNLFQQIGTLPNNFEQTLPNPISNKAIQSFKDEYLLDFVNLEDPEDEDERLIENEIVRNIKTFMMSLGSEFAFIGNQHRLIVEEQEYFIDLLFFNRKLQALVAFELKKGKFKPEYMGKMNFYLSALDDMVKQEHENPSIGIILCKEKKNRIVEYSIRDQNKAMGVATYKSSNEIPERLRNVLPSAEILKKLMN